MPIELTILKFFVIITSSAKSTNNIVDQSARTLVYNEIRLLLPSISDVNLRKRTFKAKKVYTLFEGIGVDMIRQITYSANAISSLTDIQIQNIINRFRKKSTNINDTINCQEVIGVPKKNAYVTEPSSSNDISNTEVSIPDKLKKLPEAKKIIPETSVSALPSAQSVISSETNTKNDHSHIIKLRNQCEPE
ncbi:7020_t:CDS:2 [Diversispora eburnea]|uniref:7020_t:CDS:1 n=1 Tax=Diversispora eburnea TaxID=1213867 RepID=A0A9N9C3Z8_9GLOM|nr:7020_t:CDS:2 [Diversispora eburnea]